MIIFIPYYISWPEFEKIIRCLAENPYGLYRKQLSEKLLIAEGGPLSSHLSDLESAGFISSQTPFYRQKKSRQIKYFLTDAYSRFYFAFIQPNLKKIQSGLQSDIFARISQSGAFAAWMGRSFEYVCLQHAREIARSLCFAAIDFSAGPYFNPRDGKSAGVQIDLLFDRADKVITLCEMKYTIQPVGIEIIESIDKKAAVLSAKFPSRTIQKVLITQSSPSRELAASGYFYRIITAQELLDRN